MTMVQIKDNITLERVRRWSDLLLQKNDAAAIADTAVTLLRDWLPVTLCTVCLCPGETGVEWTVVGPASEGLARRLAEIRAALADKVLAINGNGRYEPHPIDATWLGLSPSGSTVLATPLYTQRSLLGVLLLGPADDVLASDIAPQLPLLAAYLSLALENASLYASTAQREREIELISETGKQLTQLQSLSELMPQLVREVSQTFNYDSMGLLLVEENGDLVVRETIGLEREKHLGFRVPVTDRPEGGITGRVAYQGVACLVPDVLLEKHYIRTVETTRSELAVPLKIKDRVIGVLDVQSVVVGGVTVKDMLILTTLADQVAIAVENARLYEELAQAHDELGQKAEQLQHLLARTVQIQEDERRRIAADIHDSVIQLVYGALYQVEGSTQRLPDGSEARASLQEVRASLNQAIAETHKAIYDLWPSSLDEMGLLPSVESYLARFEQATGIRCTLQTTGARVRFTPQARIAIYRIIQEALTNIRKYARATRVETVFHFTPSRVRVTVRDDGQGFKRGVVSASGGGLGLIAMRERAQNIGGTFDIRAAHPGTVIALEFPRSQVERKDQSDREDTRPHR